MFKRPWEHFFDAHIRIMIANSSSILDIGGGLRIDSSRGNRVEAKYAWIPEALTQENTSYRVLDYVDTYNPDIVGDIQALPLPDESEEAIVCISVLEHVPNPFKGIAEMYRVLKPGGYCYIYVPFLFYYHAERGYYADYWRFTEDSLRHLCAEFSEITICKTRGPVEMLVRLSPLGRFPVLCDLGYLVDRVCKKHHSPQTSGFNVFLKK